MLAKKLRPNLDCEPKCFLPKHSQTQPPVSYCLEKKKLFRLALLIGKAIKKKLCVVIVTNKDTKRRNFRKKIAMLSKTKEIDEIPPEYKELQ